MRCREARLRLTVLAETGQDASTDRELSEHLKQCQACTKQADASQDLRRAMAAASTHDQTGGLAWPDLKRRVEEQVSGSLQNQPKETPLMSTFKKQIKLRPRLTVGLATAAIVLLAATLIPLKFDRTVGFEVAVAGVDRDLALNQERLDGLLERLGLENVHIDITGCDVTCNLVVSDLSSQDDARMIRLAFQEIGKNEVLVELKSVREDVSESALKHAVQNIWFGGSDSQDDEELHRIVIERLGDDFEGENVLFFANDNRHVLQVTGTDGEGVESEFSWVSSDENGSDDDHQMLFYVDEGESDKTYHMYQVASHPELEDRHWDGNRLTDEAIAEFRAQGWDLSASDDGTTVTFRRIKDDNGQTPNAELYITTDGESHPHAALITAENIVDGRLTAETRESLEAMGYAVEETANDDGTLTIRLTSDEAGNKKVLQFKIDVDEPSDPDVAKQVDLPDGYALSQNYPNPFNPTTQIDYSLPRSEHVTIEVFNVKGQKVRTLIDEVMPAGNHTVVWDADSDDGNRVASGVYLYRFSAGSISDTKKMTLVK